MGCTKSKPQAPSATAAAKTKEPAAEDFVQVASERALDVPPPVPEQSLKSTQPPPLPFGNKKAPATETGAAASPPLPVKPDHLKPVEAEEDQAVEELAAPVKTYEEVADEEVADEEVVETPVAVEEEQGVVPEDHVVLPSASVEEEAADKDSEPQVVVLHTEEVLAVPAEQPTEQPAIVVVEKDVVIVAEPLSVVAVSTEEQVESEPQVPLTMGQKLHRENAVIYPSASAALASKGLQKYAPDLEKRGIVSYKDLTTFEEDLSDPFWSKMPPYPDRKKMNALLEDARIAFGIDEGGVTPAPAAVTDEADAVPMEEEEDDDEPEYVPVREKTELPCDTYDVDVYAKEFSTCTCGHAKMQHKQFALDGNRAPSFVTTRQASNKFAQDAAAATSPRSGSEVCTQFKLDLSAPNPICVTCGLTKPAHLQTGSVADSPNRFKEMNKGSFKKPSQA
ncbi:hypothetical protein BASA81_007407 [Batrachochytrium salamandrivorans]|nr:hypothetical protein BASA81_007407 [Batrachochytrium salamandrivorans]